MQPAKMKSFPIASVTALGFLLVTVPVASAQSVFQCSNGTTITDGRTIDSNVVVPPSATCELDNVTVIGNVKVGTGAALQAFPVVRQKVAINGNIAADGCGHVELETSGGGTISVAGNVTAQNCNGASYSGHCLTIGSGPCLTIGGNVVFAGTGAGTVASEGVIHGNLTVDNNNTKDLPIPPVVEGNQVSGNVEVSGNAVPSPLLVPLVKGNTIGGNLQCVGNSQTPDDGGIPNTVSGQKLGQCAGL